MRKAAPGTARRMVAGRRASLLLAMALPAMLMNGCGDLTYTLAPTTGNGSVGTTTNVAVTITPASSAVDVGQTLGLSATVTGDSSNRGVTWSIVSGGGTVSPSTGMTTTFVAPSEGTVTVIRAASVLDATRTATAVITVNSAPAFTMPGQLPQGFVGVGYSATLASTGGTGAINYAVVSGALPTGLTLNSTTGALTGTPTAGGNTTFTARVTDSANPAQTGTASFTVVISALQLTSPVLPGGVVGQAYAPQTYTSAFNQGAVTFAVTSGALPAGLSLSTSGVLSGTPSAAGTNNFTVSATDAAGQQASGAQTVNVAATLALAGRTLTPATAGTAYTASVAATGGTAPYTYSVTAGSALPPGLALSTSGVVSGTPTTAGTYNFSLSAADSGTGASAQTATANYTLTVAPGPLSITTATLPSAVLSSPYSVTLQAQGGVSPYSFNLQSGALPTGLTLASSGALSGKPTANGTYSFTVRVIDVQGMTATRAFTITVSSTLPPGPNNALLNGSYAFLVQGQTNGALQPSAATNGGAFGADAAGAMTFNGAGSVTGTIETNDAITGYVAVQSITGSYTVDADNRGRIVFTAGANTRTFAIAVATQSAGIATRIRMIAADSLDPNNPSQMQATGIAARQTPADFNGTALTGRYTFALDGETPCSTCSNLGGQYGAISAAGYFNLAGAGIITGGEEDSMTYSAAFNQIALSGSYTLPDNKGRGTLTLTPVSTFTPAIPGGPQNFAYYVISARQIVLLSMDSHTGASLLAGMGYQQQQALFSAASLSGSLLTAESSVSGGNGSTAPPSTRAATLTRIAISSNGIATGTQDSNAAGTVTMAAPLNITYTVSDEGRVVLNTGAANLPVFWLYDVNAGVGTELHAGAGAIGTATLDAQGTGFTPPTLSGTFALGTTPAVTPAMYVNGALTANGSNSATLTVDTSQNGVVTNGTTSTVATSVAGSGQVTLTGAGSTYFGYFINGQRTVVFNATPGFKQPVVITGDK